MVKLTCSASVLAGGMLLYYAGKCVCPGKAHVEMVTTITIIITITTPQVHIHADLSHPSVSFSDSHRSLRRWARDYHSHSQKRKWVQRGDMACSKWHSRAIGPVEPSSPDVSAPEGLLPHESNFQGISELLSHLGYTALSLATWMKETSSKLGSEHFRADDGA